MSNSNWSAEKLKEFKEKSVGFIEKLRAETLSKGVFFSYQVEGVTYVDLPNGETWEISYNSQSDSINYLKKVR
ncbi:MAG: hypothetical protein J0M08_12095 [Bacteroidetes bacterium]|nr:hypothetical protein [Bacteroidota bacterium]